jgi:hypothetical protein
MDMAVVATGIKVFLRRSKRLSEESSVLRRLKRFSEGESVSQKVKAFLKR